MSSKLLAITVLFAALMVAPAASANYEYTCGEHRDARCHSEARGDNYCSYQNDCFGRCGPNCSWSALGQSYTIACNNHDQCVQYQMCTLGNGSWTAQANCAGGLASAVASVWQQHWNYGFQHAHDSVSGFWKKIKGCCN